MTLAAWKDCGEVIKVTRLVTLVAAIASKLEVRTDADQEVDEMARDVAPEAVLDASETT